MKYRIDTLNPVTGVWEPGSVVFDLRTTSLADIYADAQRLACDMGCDTRVVVVTTIEWITVEPIRVFGGVAGVASNAVAES